MLSKVMVANRGEIAVRIFRACKELGIPTVAVYSEADAHALFVKYADEKYCIGPGPARMSYLVKEKLIDVALKAGVDGIHPGYGFLAENEQFAKMCGEAKIEFIGPPPNAMAAMGSKIESKKTMIAHNVPVVPGTVEPVSDSAEAKRIAREVGYPVMIKAAAGGGGIGIKKVDKEDEMDKALESNRQLAKNSFGDDTVFIEKCVIDPRHIEFQVIGDKHGHMIHVNERECSMQRRHQKLIEETPSCALTPEIRAEMGKAAVTAAQAVGYWNAGTCEFMFKDGKFYFLEMNTRLQVEHPITEQITGIDLAREQLRVASGYELQYKQEDVKARGHCIECRINAEDPLNNFAPAPGKIIRYAEPGGPGIRIDSGVYAGFEIPPYYDSMIAKLIVWAEDRPRCIERVKRALWEFQISGVRHNIPFHEVVMNEQVFKSGNYNTSYIPQYHILEKVTEYVKAKKEQSSGPKTAAAMAGVGAVINAMSQGGK
ncbi:MAG: acetyl-CoA carboxylase biotin carboxylase subunit [Methanobacteriota archaeon]